MNTSQTAAELAREEFLEANVRRPMWLARHMARGLTERSRSRLALMELRVRVWADRLGTA